MCAPEKDFSKKVSIIVPLLNEEGNVDILYHKLKGVLSGLSFSHELIFVDDGSFDGTYGLLKRLRSGDKGLFVIKFTRNFGQSAALAAGFGVASGDFAVTIDGDLQCDPKYIGNFLEELERGADVVCSWRQAGDLCSWIMRIPSLIGNFLGAFLFGLDVHDFSCSFRAYNKAFYKRLYLAKGLHRFIPVIAKFEGRVIREVKIPCLRRNKGVSKYSYLRFPKVIIDAVLLKIIEMLFKGSYERLFKDTGFTIDLNNQ